MATTAQALLFVYGEPTPHVAEDKFHEWYDNEHAPARARVPGFLSVARYKALDVKMPTWLALYEMESAEVLKSEAYRSLAGSASQNEKDVIANLSVLNRRVYSLLLTTGKDTGTSAKFIYVVHAQVEGDEKADAAFLKWYSDTRIPLLSNVPGWERSRIYQLEDHSEMGGKAEKAEKDKAVSLAKKAPMKYLVLHEFSRDGAEVTDSLQFKECMTAEKPWAMPGESTVAEMEDRRFGLYKSFDITAGK